MNVTEAVELGEILLGEFGLYNWAIALDNSKRRFGSCQHHRHTISLSKPLVELNSRADVEDTIRHEIAHALVDVNHGHDRVWKAKCIEVGANPSRTYDESVVQPQCRWTLVCPDCAVFTQRHKRSRGAFKHDPNHGVMIWIDNRLKKMEES